MTCSPMSPYWIGLFLGVRLPGGDGQTAQPVRQHNAVHIRLVPMAATGSSMCVRATQCRRLLEAMEHEPDQLLERLCAWPVEAAIDRGDLPHPRCPAADGPPWEGSLRQTPLTCRPDLELMPCGEIGIAAKIRCAAAHQAGCLKIHYADLAAGPAPRQPGGTLLMRQGDPPPAYAAHQRAM